MMGLQSIPARLIVVWRVTQKCNVSCQFCAYSSALGGTRIHADTHEVLRLGGLLARAQKMKNQSAPLICWLGGEPFLWPELASVSRLFRREYGLGLSLTTNGLNLHSAATRQLILDDFEEIIVSVDGLPEFNNWCRDQRNLFENLKKNIRLLHVEKMQSGKDLRIKVNTILMRGNIQMFGELCRELQTWGVNALSFNELGGKSRPEFFPDNHLLPEQFENFRNKLPDIRKEMAATNFVIHGSENYLQRLADSTDGHRIFVEDCLPGQKFLFISETGRIAPCSATLAEYGIETAMIRTAEDVVNIADTFRKMRATTKAGACADCRCTSVFGKFA